MMHLIWPADSGFAIGIVLVIFWLGAWGVRSAIWHRRLLRQELADIANVENKLDEWDNERETLIEAAANEEEAADQVNPDLRLRPTELDARLKELESMARDGSHIRHRIVAIRRLRAHQVKVNLDTLQQLTWAEERTRRGIETPRQVAGWVMMLGVVGTFVGLSDMVQEIRIHIPEGQVGVDDMIASLKDLKNVLQGMQTAFSTSVDGMLVALLSAWFAFSVQRLQGQMFSVLESVTVGKLIPASVSSLDDDSILERISIQMEQAFAHLESVTEQNLSSMQEFSAAQGALQSIVKDVQAILNAESRQDVRAVIDRIVETNTLVGKLVDKLPDIVVALGTTNRELNEGLAQLDKTVRTRPMIHPEDARGFVVVSSRGLALLALVGWALLIYFGFD